MNKFNFELFWGFRELINGVEHGKFATVQYLGNVLFFVPFGFLFPIKKNAWITIIIACVFSGIIELLQYVTALGLCEIDDVIANTVGSIIGIYLYKLIKRAYERS